MVPEEVPENISEKLEEFIRDMQVEFAIQSGDRAEFVLFTEDEYDLIVEAALLGILDNDTDLDEDELLDQVHQVVRWAEEIATGQALIEGMLLSEVMVRPNGQRQDAIDLMIKVRDTEDPGILEA